MRYDITTNIPKIYDKYQEQSISKRKKWFQQAKAKRTLLMRTKTTIDFIIQKPKTKREED